MMSTTTYNVLSVILGIGVLIALGVAGGSFIAMLVRWKTPRRRTHVVRLLGALAAAPVLVGIQQAILWLVFLPGLGEQQLAEFNAARGARHAASTLVSVGEPAPDFGLTTIDGDEFRLSDARGRVVMVNFFATWCGPCRQELPHVESIWQRYRDRPDFRLVVIGREESDDAVREFRSEQGFSFPMAADPERAVYSLFATESIPRTLIIAPDGTVAYSQTGFIQADLAALEAALEEQLAALDR
jgi:peroxiredoxin